MSEEGSFKKAFKTGCGCMAAIAVAVAIMGAIGAFIDDSSSGESKPSKPWENRPQSVSKPQPPPQPKRKAKEMVWLSARELFTAYELNPMRANGQYKGKVLNVSGRVSNIQPAIFGNEVYLTLGDVFEGVQANFADGKRLLKISQGDHVTVRCNKVTDSVLSNAILSDCILAN